MTLIERYLNEVKFWLPGAHAEEVILALGEELRAQIEGQESSLGRKLTETEVAAILKTRGQPALVAARHLPIQHVVGPALFPFYWSTLKICVLGAAVVHVVMSVLKSATSAHPVTDFISATPNLISGAIWTVGVLTIVFGALEYFHAEIPIEKLEPFGGTELRNTSLNRTLPSTAKIQTETTN